MSSATEFSLTGPVTAVLNARRLVECVMRVLSILLSATWMVVMILRKYFSTPSSATHIPVAPPIFFSAKFATSSFKALDSDIESQSVFTNISHLAIFNASLSVRAIPIL